LFAASLRFAACPPRLRHRVRSVAAERDGRGGRRTLSGRRASLEATGSVAHVRTCDFCGRQAEDEATTLTWSVAVENGRQRTYCDTCSREHLRAMESKLDSEWW